MREIKFRLWCKDLEEIIEVNKMGFENNELWYIECIDHDKELLYFSEKNDHVLMRYTGLLDIKGKQIYDADLIKDDENFIWEVIYKQGAFYAKCDDLMAVQLLSSVNLFGVVVGNKYDNPELLGDTN
ncbi:YopX family protein [Psychrobacillus sp. FSL H8-0487]|uniref:YopX family protein n=1 Tax=Psychrobacillus sp. FSL H8-0487 TaxID=2921391 RepID=UPI0030FCF4F4